MDFRDSPDAIPMKKFEAEGWTDIAIEFLKRNKQDGRPFFLTVAMGPPHDPYGAPGEYMRMYDPAKLTSLTKINTYHALHFAYYLEKLRSTPDGDGTLLDHMIIMYGAGMADSNLHAPNGLPLMLIGGGSGALKGGRHLKYQLDTPVANLHLTLLDKLGVSTVDRIGDSTGRVEHLSVA